MKTNLVAVRLTDGQSMTAFRIGGGNTSRGIQRALDSYRGRNIPARFAPAPARQGGDARDLGTPGRVEDGSSRRPADAPAHASD